MMEKTPCKVTQTSIHRNRLIFFLPSIKKKKKVSVLIGVIRLFSRESLLIVQLFMIILSFNIS
jgi:hypothetical protein